VVGGGCCEEVAIIAAISYRKPAFRIQYQYRYSLFIYLELMESSKRKTTYSTSFPTKPIGLTSRSSGATVT